VLTGSSFEVVDTSGFVSEPSSVTERLRDRKLPPGVG